MNPCQFVLSVLVACGLAVGIGTAALANLIQFTATVAPSFTGVGDTLSGAKAHWGSIAYSVPSRGSNMYSICDNATQGSGTCKDIATDGTTGLVSSTQTVGSIGTCGTGGNQCWIDKVYDDSGSNFCSAAPCNLVIANLANRALFVPNAFGTLPAVGCRITGSGRFSTTATPTLTGSIDMLVTVKFSALPNGSGAGDQPVNFNNGSGVAFDFYDFANITYFLRGGGFGLHTTGLATATNYVLMGYDDGAGAGNINVNGSNTTGTVSTGSVSGAFHLCDSVSHTDGNFAEYTYYNANITSSVATLYGDMHTNAGF